MMKQTNYYSELNNVSLTCDSTMKDMEFNKDIELAISQPSTNSATLDVSNPNVLTYELPAINAFRITPKPIPMEILRSLINAERNSKERAKELKLKSTDPQLKEILISYLTADVYTLPKERLQERVNDILIDIQDELEADEYGRPIRPHNNYMVHNFYNDFDDFFWSANLAFEGQQSDIDMLYDLITNHVDVLRSKVDVSCDVPFVISAPEIIGGILYANFYGSYPPKVAAQLMKAYPQIKVHYIRNDTLLGDYVRNKDSNIVFPYNYTVMLNIKFDKTVGMCSGVVTSNCFTTIEEAFSYISEESGKSIHSLEDVTEMNRAFESFDGRKISAYIFDVEAE